MLARARLAGRTGRSQCVWPTHRGGRMGQDETVIREISMGTQNKVALAIRSMAAGARLPGFRS